MNQRLTDAIASMTTAQAAGVHVPEEEKVLAALLAHAASQPDKDRGNQMFAAILHPYSHEQLAAIVASLARVAF